MNSKTYRFIAWGGLGDLLLATPTFKAIKEQQPGSRIILFCPRKWHAIYAHNPYIDDLRSKGLLPNLWHNLWYNLKYFAKRVPFQRLDYGRLAPSLCYYDKGAAEILAEMSGVTLQDKQLQIFLTAAEEEKARRYLAAFQTPVLINVVGRASANKMWTLPNWTNLVSQFPEVDFIQLGLADETPIPGATDLRGKTNIRESLALMKYTRSFIGIDSFLAHATNAFGIPGVVLFGASTPVVWGHSNNINLFNNALPCSPCLDTIFHIECPYGRECMLQLTVDMVAKALKTQLARSGTR